MSGTITGMQTVTVHVTDFARARTFYQNAFGLKELNAMEEMGWAMYAVPNGVPIGIHVWTEDGCGAAGGRPPNTVTGVILEVDDPHAFAEKVVNNGGTLTDPVEKLPWGPVGGTVADPDGNEFAFSEPMPEQ